MREKKMNTRDVVLTGMLTAVLAVMSQISIPLPSGVPITLQTFGVALCGAVLGWKLGTIAVFAYVLLGMVGAPVFAGFQGGIAILLGKTGGFIWGFIIMALLCGAAQSMKNKCLASLLGIAGLAIDHILGVVGFAILTGVGLKQSFLLVSLPFLLKDIISVLGAFAIAAILHKQLLAANLFGVQEKKL